MAGVKRKYQTARSFSRHFIFCAPPRYGGQVAGAAKQKREKERERPADNRQSNKSNKTKETKGRCTQLQKRQTGETTAQRELGESGTSERGQSSIPCGVKLLLCVSKSFANRATPSEAFARKGSIPATTRCCLYAVAKLLPLARTAVVSEGVGRSYKQGGYEVIITLYSWRCRVQQPFFFPRAGSDHNKTSLLVHTPPSIGSDTYWSGAAPLWVCSA